MDLPDPPLERVTLTGCDRVVAVPAHFDVAYVEPIVNGRTGDFTALFDVTVSASDGDRIELTGRVEQQRHLRPDGEPPEADGFQLSLDDDTVIARCRTVDGFFRERTELLAPPVTLLGFRPSPGFAAALAAWRPDGTEDLELSAAISARHADGPEFGILEPGVFSTVRAVRPSALGPDLLDVELEDGVWEPLPAGARPLWESWLRQRPTVSGTWVPLSPHMRHEWLRLALADHRYRARPDRPAGTTYHLDGTQVTDGNAFYCALGEAINGPGGYFGWNGYALNDCLRGEWGAAPPFTLRWTAHEKAKNSMGVESFTELMAVFAQADVTVTLA
ncbi:barstar family protein [Actinoplanes xinjiangensis]|uniref:barstar family protein n=1 Tax=Actinoplanes xinjiangensis TaxID=512350 RepID=UPI003442AE0D